MQKLLRLFIMASLIGATAPAMSQNYPVRPITMVVPAAPGGLTDVFVQLLGEQVRKDLGQPLVMEHRGGAGGIVASKHVAQSAPDGYTFLMGNVGNLAINSGLDPNLSYDVARDFVPVAYVVLFHNVLVVHPSVPAQNVQQLIALAKQQPGKMGYASAGVGQSHHLSGELFKQAVGIDIIHVPYKGAAPAMVDLTGGHVPMMFANIPLAIKHIEAGSLRPLAVTGAKRSESLPNVPTMEEAGVKGYNVYSWLGIVAPAGTPQPIVNRMNEIMAKVMQSEAGKAQLKKINAEPAFGTPAEFGAFMASEQRKWREVIRKGNIKAQ
ncbi:MAG: tripartite tricarboxylate transporter substrate binding protein [Burkholderiaceae bacterium]|nr:tripartite tricarboxylate transporter substrate binding protein [Burkholderiaceae bacterium]MDO9089947.1 tripartite tricarboxylate transporter substrate binding protein [Burkholderiaceae bacterium]